MQALHKAPDTEEPRVCRAPPTVLTEPQQGLMLLRWKIEEEWQLCQARRNMCLCAAVQKPLAALLSFSITLGVFGVNGLSAESISSFITLCSLPLSSHSSFLFSFHLFLSLLFSERERVICFTQTDIIYFFFHSIYNMYTTCYTMKIPKQWVCSVQECFS